MKCQSLLLSLAIALTIATSSLFAQEQAPAPALKDGDTWQFHITAKGQRGSSSERFTGTYDLVFSQGKIKLYEIDGDKRTEIEIKWEGFGSELTSLIGIQQERPTLKFPLSVDQKWKYEFTDRPIRPKDNVKFFVEVAVMGIEEATTRAGSFKAFKLARNEQRRTGGPQDRWISTTTTYFYSPDTKSVIKSTRVNEDTAATTETELIKFTPGK